MFDKRDDEQTSEREESVNELNSTFQEAYSYSLELCEDPDIARQVAERYVESVRSTKD